jgi:hypothetical protein
MNSQRDLHRNALGLTAAPAQNAGPKIELF